MELWACQCIFNMPDTNRNSNRREWYKQLLVAAVSVWLGFENLYIPSSPETEMGIILDTCSGTVAAGCTVVHKSSSSEMQQSNNSLE